MLDKDWKSAVDKSFEVKVAYLHQAIMAAGALNTDKTFSATKHKGLRMYWNPQGLLYEIKGVRGCIPAANVANILYMMEADLQQKTA